MAPNPATKFPLASSALISSTRSCLSSDFNKKSTQESRTKPTPLVEVTEAEWPMGYCPSHSTIPHPANPNENLQFDLYAFYNGALGWWENDPKNKKARTDFEVNNGGDGFFRESFGGHINRQWNEIFIHHLNYYVIW